MDKSSCSEFPDNCAIHILVAQLLELLDGVEFNGGFGEFDHDQYNSAIIFFIPTLSNLDLSGVS